MQVSLCNPGNPTKVSCSGSKLSPGWKAETEMQQKYWNNVFNIQQYFWHKWIAQIACFTQSKRNFAKIIFIFTNIRKIFSTSTKMRLTCSTYLFRLPQTSNKQISHVCMSTDWIEDAWKHSPIISIKPTGQWPTESLGQIKEYAQASGQHSDWWNCEYFQS